MCSNMPPLELAIQFHGHISPDLLMGVRVAEFALKQLQVDHDESDDLLAIVENVSGGVDAIQSILGCTLGKGNLIVKDKGKFVYTIASRNKNTAIRIAQHYNALKTPVMENFYRCADSINPTAAQTSEYEMLLGQVFEFIMTSNFDDLFKWDKIEDFSFPAPAAKHKPILPCSVCAEGVMEVHAARTEEKVLCPDCKISLGGK